MTALTVRQTERLARKTELALVVAIVLGAVEILRRSPRWLLVFVGLLAYTVVVLVIVYVWWVVAALAAIVVWKLARGFVRGWRLHAISHTAFRRIESANAGPDKRDSHG